EPAIDDKSDPKCAPPAQAVQWLGAGAVVIMTAGHSRARRNGNDRLCRPCSNYRVKMATGSLSIGELARLTSTKVETVRYYERIGLLPSPARTGGNYRAYTRRHLERLSFIRRGRDLGFSLDEVRELLRLSDDRDRSCAEVDRIARAHLTEVERKLADLAALGA